jgi:DNA (cytosine-5)-methyltransferase 1
MNGSTSGASPEDDTSVPYRIVDLFAGPGGFDEAARLLNIAAVGVEWDGDACQTRHAADLNTVCEDVRNHGPLEFPSATVLLGGPPCQTYTVAGGGHGRKNLDVVLHYARMLEHRIDVTEELWDEADIRTHLILEPLRWAMEAIDAGGPYQTVILEQVPTVLPVWHEIAAILEREGYSTACGVLRAEQYGVPQTRRRAVLIARRDGSASLPAPTHRDFRKSVARDEGDISLRPWRTMADVLSRPGPFEVVSNYGSGGDPKARGRRRSTEPAFTVTGKVSRNRVVHAGTDTDAEPPRITSEEASVLQTFRRDFEWRGHNVAQQIGNAVPPRLGVHILVEALDLDPAVLPKLFPDLDYDYVRPEGVTPTLVCPTYPEDSAPGATG